MKLKKVRFDIQINGATGKKFYNTGIVTTVIQPWFDQSDEIKFSSHFYLMKQLPQTNSFKFERNIPEFNGLILADPEFNRSSAFHLLLGIEFWVSIIQEKLIFSTSGLCAQKTIFGYVVFGTILQSERNLMNATAMRITIEDKEFSVVNQLLARFWELNDSSECNLTVAEERAERLFSQSTERDKNGRFIVRIPFIDGDIELGESRAIASQRFNQLERRFNRDPDLREKYNEFMKEYLELGHMREATIFERRARGYYIPHHAVTKRFRVVFDASCATSNGKSVNDIQLPGPNRQEHLFVIIMRFRFHKIVVTTDVRKMFRQFKIHSDDLIFQKILWRFSATEQLKEYVLLTVTYGMKASPFLAIRCMLELARFYKDDYPLASRATELERYVDDYFSGADTEEQLVRLYDELRSMLAQAGLELGKWKTNCPQLLERINCDLAENTDHVQLSDEYASVLGLNWCPVTDYFFFNVELTKIENETVSKRTVVSEVAKLYDPNGYLGPIVVRAKMFIQQLWLLKIDWDDLLSEELFKQWKEYYEQLIALNEVRIPRWLQTTTVRRIELVGFADASLKAYGAVIYVRSSDDNNAWCTLLTAKSRVAPLNAVSIPRLELCAAELLAKLMFEVRDRCGLSSVSYYLYTDSTITLQWIQKESTIFKPFVSNRVASIQRNTNKELWFHVPTEQNPADLLSRGMSVLELKHSKLWWQGPDFLSEKHDKWPNDVPHVTQEQLRLCRGEYKVSVFSAMVTKKVMKNCLEINGNPLIDLYSTLSKLIRITAYVMRAFKKNERQTIGFSNDQLNNSLEYWIRFTQHVHFEREIRSMQTHGNNPGKSDLVSLKPFFGKDGLLRVWGRIANAEINYDERHPIIIPAHSQFARLLMHEAHFKTKHGNVQIMLHYVRAKYWVIQSKRAALKVVKSCVRCIRYAQRTEEQLMGDLPKERMMVALPFTYCGVDHFGPINLKRFEGRCKTIIMGYVAVFVCMTTKMIHLECCTDLTTQKFIWALTRFSSIYRTPEKVFSDNGRTFVGANNELRKIAESWQSKEMCDWITENYIQWKFITPRAPNQGGLWEAAVKSTKYHLKRIIGVQQFTFERYQTILAGISAVLNSRPLVPLTSDPSDLNYLTPAHSIRGSRLVQPLTRNISDLSVSEIKIHRAMEKMQMDFWTGFRKDYLSTLQSRYKWKDIAENLKVGDFVIVKEDNLPPGLWSVARVINVFPGSDGIVRNVRLRTARTELQRPVRKLVRLPLNDQPNTDGADAAEND